MLVGPCLPESQQKRGAPLGVPLGLPHIPEVLVADSDPLGACRAAPGCSPSMGRARRFFTLLAAVALIPFLHLTPTVHVHLQHGYSCHLHFLPNPRCCALLRGTMHKLLASGAGAEASCQASALP